MEHDSAPPVDLRSPVIDRLLNEWTEDSNKVWYVFFFAHRQLCDCFLHIADCVSAVLGRMFGFQDSRWISHWHRNCWRVCSGSVRVSMAGVWWTFVHSVMLLSIPIGMGF